MEAFLIANMAPIMFGALVIFLLLGYPAAFSLGAVGLFFAVIGIELGLFVPDFLQALPERVYGVMSNDTLLAIPFFTFMGLVLERSGMAEDLLDTIAVRSVLVTALNLDLGRRVWWPGRLARQPSPQAGILAEWPTAASSKTSP